MILTWRFWFLLCFPQRQSTGLHEIVGEEGGVKMVTLESRGEQESSKLMPYKISTVAVVKKVKSVLTKNLFNLSGVIQENVV